MLDFIYRRWQVDELLAHLLTGQQGLIVALQVDRLLQ